MTNEEAKIFLDNLKVCIEEHPIVADWLVEIADHKTENSSEKPNNSTKATISKMEQVDKDINVRSKDESQTEDADCDKCIWSVCNYNKAFAFEDEPQADCDGCQHYADKHTADACYECKRSYTDGYEPQTERSE